MTQPPASPPTDAADEPLASICEALGWQGGTLHQCVNVIKGLREIERDYHRLRDWEQRLRAPSPAPAASQTVEHPSELRMTAWESHPTASQTEERFKRNPSDGPCSCGQRTIPKGFDGVNWYWQRHGRDACTLELPNKRCWCGLLRSEHIAGHADDVAPPAPAAPREGGDSYEKVEQEMRDAATGLGEDAVVELTEWADRLAALRSARQEPQEAHTDDLAVDRFSAAMKIKLAVARAKGRSGWDDPQECTTAMLARMLVQHLFKGNAGAFEDIANFSMMLHQRNADPIDLLDAARSIWAQGYNDGAHMGESVDGWKGKKRALDLFPNPVASQQPAQPAVPQPKEI